MNSQHYLIHRHPLTVNAPAAVAAVLARRLACFGPVGEAPADAERDRPTLRVSYHRGAPDAPGGVERLGDTAAIRLRRGSPLELGYQRERDALLVTHQGRLLLDARAAEGRAEIFFDEDPERDLRLYTHMLFTLALSELLQARGAVSLHGAAFVPAPGGGTGPGDALLICGASGCGKSTLALALLRAGFGFMGDDWALLELAPGGALRVLALPDEIDLTDDTASRFPELDLRCGRRYSGGVKRAVRPEELVADLRPVLRARPAVLLFPRVAHQPETRLAPLAPGEALARLLPQLRRTGPHTMRHGFEAFGALTRGCRAYALDTGRDLFAGDRVPRMLAELIRTAAGAAVPAPPRPAGGERR